MEIKSLESAVEAILFASGEPVSAERIAQALEIDKSTATRVIGHYVQRFNAAESGLRVVQVDKFYQMVTREEYAPYIRRALEIRRNVPLTKPSMEVLAIIAYHQPVTKGYLEQVRGVDCSGIVNNLVEKGLVEERGRMELPGRPILYGTTLSFLRCFGLNSLENLPPVEQSEAGAADETERQEDAGMPDEPGAGTESPDA